MALTGPGDIAFVGFNSDGNDNLAFVALKDIAAGQVIYFSDNEWNAAGTGWTDASESTFAWTATSAISAGTIVTIDTISTAASTSSNLGTVTAVTSGGSNRGIANSNETVYAYLANAATPLVPTAFLTAVTNNSATANGTLVNTGLAYGATALDLGAFDLDADVAAFTGLRSGQASYAAYAAIINTPTANWVTQDASGDQSIDGTSPDVPFSTAAFSAGVTTPTLSISNVTLAEGNSGTTGFVFTVTLSASATAPVTVDYVTANGTALAGSDFTGVSGTLTFAAGETSKTVTVAVTGDTSTEANETFTVTLSNASGATIATGTGTGTIANDDITITAIHDIQGATHASPLLGQTVTTTGIVTAVDTNGFYLQARDADADASDATSEAIFVFTSSAPTVRVGDAVNVAGTVTEFVPGGAATNNLSQTELVSPSVTVLSSGNALPTAIVLGATGRMAPTAVIDNDNFATFDPAQDGIDFYESLEGMRVTVPSPKVVAATNSFGEIFTVADNGANATGLSSRGVIVAQGSTGDGLAVTNTGAGSDFNPERIQIDADSFTPGTIPTVNVGTRLNDVTGVLSYNFGNYEVLATSAVTVAEASTLLRETTTLTGSATKLTIAQYNVENLDPGDGAVKFANIADQIVNNLRAPDIIALQEVQDNNGPTNDGTVSASLTLQMLVDAISAAGGPTYTWIDNPFVVNGQVGGEPGGNIRVAYLYNDARVDLVGAVSTTPGALADFNGSRVPLVATFAFAGEEVTLVNNHFTSKGGSSPLFGAVQESLNGGADARLVQAQNVADFVASLDPAQKVVVLGDLNEFTNEESLAPLSGAGLSAMSLTLSPTERYSYVFEGNAQELDQTFVSANLQTAATIDIVHVNAEFADQISDHDPALLSLDFTPPPPFPTINGIKVFDEADTSLHGSTTTPVASNDVVLVRLGSIAGASAGAESVAFENGKVYATNINGNAINVHTIGTDGTLANAAPILLSGLTGYKAGGVNSVAVKNGVIAVAYENATAGTGGYVALFNAADQSLVKTIQVGVLPDMVTFSPDGSKILVANEAEAISAGSNPNGSVSIIDLSGGAAAAALTNTISFAALNGSEAVLKAQGLALLNGQTAAADIEPEYITVSPDGTRAYVTLQEVNAVAVIDLTDPAADRPLAIQPLGFVDRSLAGNAFDASDRDSSTGTGAINLQNWSVRGLTQPDAIASFAVGGVTYFVTANEGDSRVGTGITDSVRLGDASYVLDPTAFPNAAALKANAALGRLNVLTNVGDTDNDGDFDQIYTLGGRGISIFRQEADGSLTKVRETGGEFEAITASLGTAFNSNQSTAASSFDTRSDDKGPEPEGVSIGVVNGRTYAFVGLERVGGYMVYDVTDPANAQFVSYKPQTGADLGPETSVFVSAANSPMGQNLLISGQEISNTVTVYSVQTQSDGADTIVGGSDAEVWSARAGDDVITSKGGNDTIDGGPGSDTATYSGAWTGYAVSSGGAMVADIDSANGNDGTDTLANIEFLRFNGVTVAAASAVNDAPIGADDGNAGAALAEDGNLAASGNVLANDTDADLALGLGETLTVTGARAGAEADGGTLASVAGATVIDGTYGRLTINPDGSWSYALDNTRSATQSLNDGQTVTERFTYAVTDAHGLTDTAQLGLAISGVNEVFTLQLLHFSDAEAGALAPQTAPYLAALVDAFEDDFTHSITMASGDLFLPGPFLAAGTDPSLKPVLNAVSGSTISSASSVNIPIAAVDVQIMNQIGVELSAIGNHEFDLGSRVLRDAISPNLGAAGYVGANFAYLSANLDLSGDADLAGRFTQTVGTGLLTNEEASDLKGRIAPSAVIYEGGEPIGFVGATTQMLEQISSPTGTEVKGFPTGPGPNGESNDMVLLAAQLQVAINDLIAQGVNKIVLASHLQDYRFEQQLARLLTGVDIIVSGGSHARFGDGNDQAVAFPGHSADFAETYPIVTQGADGKTTLIVNTDGEYTYLGRLVVDFDANGDIILDSLTANQAINGAYASTAENVAAAWGDTDGDLSDTAFADGTRGEQVQDLTQAVDAVIQAKDGTIYGYSTVYLEGERQQVRTQETNLGDLSADANAAAARAALGLGSGAAIVAIKNGGGIRAQIGTIENAPDGIGVIKRPPAVGGEVSQLDVENALRFDNKLMVFDTTAQGLLNILNSPNALAPNNGGWIQVGGVMFSYDPTRPAGSRVRDVALVDASGKKVAALVDDGVVNPDAPAKIQGIVLNFTANGGDGYLFKQNADNFRYVKTDGTLSAAVDESLDFTATTTITTYAGGPQNLLGEQKAFADYMTANHGTLATAYSQAETDQTGDLRIQNQSVRTDTVLVGDSLFGTAKADYLSGGAFNDMLMGLNGNDTLIGSGGDDTLDGGKGIDAMLGGKGNDTYYVDSASDFVIENANEGIDTVITSVQFTLSQHVENAVLTGIANARLSGNGLDNLLTGNDGNNRIEGFDGNDRLNGGAGDDVLSGGLGADTLTGGAGADKFLFAALAESVAGQRDVITDFEQGIDKIVLSSIDANTVRTGNQGFQFIGGAAFTRAGQLRAYADGANTIVAGDVDGDGVADFQIQLSSLLTLSATDFAL